MKLNRNIKIGDTGEDVIYLQSKLIEYGIYTYYMTEIFDEQTLKSFNLFQERMGIPVTDFVNLKSWNFLSKYYEIIEQQELKENQSIVITSNNFIIYEIPFESKNLKTAEKRKIIINRVGGINTTAENVAYNYYKMNTHYIVDSEKVYRNFDCSYVLNNSDDTIYISLVNSGELMVGYDKKIYDNNSNVIEKEDVVEIDNILYHKLKNELIFNLGEVLKTIKNKHLHNNVQIDYELKNIPEQNELINSIESIFPKIKSEFVDNKTITKQQPKKKRVIKKVENDLENK